MTVRIGFAFMAALFAALIARSPAASAGLAVARVAAAGPGVAVGPAGAPMAAGAGLIGAAPALSPSLPLLSKALPALSRPVPAAGPLAVPAAVMPALPAPMASPAAPAGPGAAPAQPAPALPQSAMPAVLPATLPAPAAALPALERFAAQARRGDPSQLSGGLFDGGHAAFSAVAEDPGPGLPGGFRIADAARAPALAAIVAQAGESAMGRRVLRAVERLARNRRRPLVFEFTAMRSAHAYVDWQTDVVRLGDALLKEDPRRAAPILIHELTHVLQKGRRLPYHAFELELEAFLVTLRSAHELGVRYPRSDFQGQTQRRFQGDLDAFIDWLRDAHDDGENISLLSGSRREFLGRLDERRAKSLVALDGARRRLQKRAATYAAMRSSRYGAAALERYRRAELEPAREKVRSAEGDLELVDRDIAMLSSASGYARYRAFADAVRAQARRLHAALAG